ncbi:MAG: hypothetical protein ACO1RX_00435 [Candidatus Sericytochromatia bacterium]
MRLFWLVFPYVTPEWRLIESGPMRYNGEMWQRLWLYIGEMYPPIPSFLIAVVSFFNLYFMLSLIHGERLAVTWPSIGGALTLFLFLLFLRISDELKDLETDRILFPERLVPSGKVWVSDLKLLMTLAIAGMLILNGVVTGVPFAFAVLFGYGVLMFFYFFQRARIAPSLLLALLTHNPSVLLMNAYVVALFCQEHAVMPWQAGHAYLIALCWLPGLAWELARKIRAPQDENNYVTYSQIFGYRWAALLPPLVLSLHAGMVLGLRETLGLSGLFCGVLLLMLGILLVYFGRFLWRPDSQSARLKPVTEAYMLVAALGLLVDLVALRGLVWWPT